jgi:hypothetical protein
LHHAAGADDRGLILTRLDDRQRQLAEADHDAQAFVGHGKKLPTWIESSIAGAAHVGALSSLVRAACEHARKKAGQGAGDRTPYLPK